MSSEEKRVVDPIDILCPDCKARVGERCQDEYVGIFQFTHHNLRIASASKLPAVSGDRVGSNATYEPWQKLAGAIIDKVNMTPEDYVNEDLVEELKRFFVRIPKDGPAEGIATCKHCDLPIRETHMGRVRNEWEHLNGLSFCANSSNYAWPKAAEPASPVAPTYNYTGVYHCQRCGYAHAGDCKSSQPTPVVVPENEVVSFCNQLAPVVVPRENSLQHAADEGKKVAMFRAAKVVLEMFKGGNNPTEYQLDKLSAAIGHYEFTDTIPAPVVVSAEETEDLYFFEAGPDGAHSEVLPESKLKQTVHDSMCMCGMDWQSCGSEGVTETCELLNDDGEWNSASDIKRWSWGQDFEDGHLRITRLLSPHPAPLPSQKDEQASIDLFKSSLAEIMDDSTTSDRRKLDDVEHLLAYSNVPRLSAAPLPSDEHWSNFTRQLGELTPDSERIKAKILSKIDMTKADPEDWIWETLAVLESEGKLPINSAALPVGEKESQPVIDGATDRDGKV
jgi:hypothetical protein